MPIRTGGSRPPDDLDLLVDEILGPAPSDRPGVADVLLVAAGLVALCWVVVLGAAPWIAYVGVVAIVLGLALPVRSLVRRSRSAATARRVRSAGRRGYLLDGAVPEGPEQRAYVAKRTTAIADLGALLTEAGLRNAERARESAAEQEARRRRWVDAVAAARDELQAEDRQGSLARIGRVSRRLRQEADEAADADA